MGWHVQGHDVGSTGWPLEFARADILGGVVGDEMKVRSVDGDGDRL